MKAELKITRSPAVLSETQAEELNQWSDHRSVHDTEEDILFAAVCRSQNEAEEKCRRAEKILGFPFPLNSRPSSWFDSHTLVLVISEERSGSSALTLKSAEKKGTEAELILSRTRGMTMDMSLALIEAELEETGIESVLAKAVNDHSAEALLF